MKFGVNYLGLKTNWTHYIRYPLYVLRWNWFYTRFRYDGCPHHTIRLGCFQIKWGSDYTDETLEDVEVDNYGWENYPYSLCKDGSYQI